jgi:hypothetical protein
MRLLGWLGAGSGQRAVSVRLGRAETAGCEVRGIQSFPEGGDDSGDHERSVVVRLVSERESGVGRVGEGGGDGEVGLVAKAYSRRLQVPSWSGSAEGRLEGSGVEGKWREVHWA